MSDDRIKELETELNHLKQLLGFALGGDWNIVPILKEENKLLRQVSDDDDERIAQLRGMLKKIQCPSCKTHFALLQETDDDE